VEDKVAARRPAFVSAAGANASTRNENIGMVERRVIDNDRRLAKNLGEPDAVAVLTRFAGDFTVKEPAMKFPRLTWTRRRAIDRAHRYDEKAMAGKQRGMWVAPALNRSEEYTRWRTCRCARPRTPRSCSGIVFQNRRHMPCCWLPFTIYEFPSRVVGRTCSLGVSA